MRTTQSDSQIVSFETICNFYRGSKMFESLRIGPSVSSRIMSALSYFGQFNDLSVFSQVVKMPIISLTHTEIAGFHPARGWDRVGFLPLPLRIPEGVIPHFFFSSTKVILNHA